LSEDNENKSYSKSENSTIRDNVVDNENVCTQSVHTQPVVEDGEGGIVGVTTTLTLRIPVAVFQAYRRLDRQRKRLAREVFSQAVLSLVNAKIERRSDGSPIILNLNLNIAESKVINNVLDPEVLEKENKVLREEKKRLKETIEFYEKELERRDQDVKELQEKLREAQDKLRDLQQLESLRTQLEQLRRENESLRRWIQEALLRLEKGNVEAAKALLNSLLKSKPLG